MKIIIQKSVPEEIQIEVPGYFKKVSLTGSYKCYTKITSEKDLVRINLWENGQFYTCNYDSKNDVINAVSESEPITEAEFLKAVQECYTRFFLAAETSKDETEVTAFNELMLEKHGHEAEEFNT